MADVPGANPRQSAAHMGPPVNHGGPSFSSPTRRGLHRPQPLPDNPMATDRPLVLNAEDYSRAHTPHNRWISPTPPRTNPHGSLTPMGPPVHYPSPPFVSPTRGAAHRSQLPMEHALVVSHPPVVNARGYPSTSSPCIPANPQYSAADMGSPLGHASAPFRRTPLPVDSMAVDHDHALVVNAYGHNSGGTPYSHSTTVPPPRANPRYSNPHPSPQAAHRYAETDLHWQMPDQDGVLPLSRMHSSPQTPTNRRSQVQYLGDVPSWLHVRERNGHHVVSPSNYTVI